MTGLTIYGTARSRTARVLWMAKELGLAFEHVPLAMGDAALKQPPFLKINPAGRVPAIDDDGFVMAESLAINLYLARKYGDRASPSLAPASREQEAKIWQWSSWAMTDLEVPMNFIHLHRNFFPPERRDPKIADRRGAGAAAAGNAEGPCGQRLPAGRALNGSGPERRFGAVSSGLRAPDGAVPHSRVGQALPRAAGSAGPAGMREAGL